MERVRTSEFFYLDEFVDPHTYFNNMYQGRLLIDERLFRIANLLRSKYGYPLYINTWWRYYKEKERLLNCDDIIGNIERSATLRKWSGLRTNRSPVGKKTSAHFKGKAIDLVGDETVLFSIIKNNAKEFYDLGVRRIEDISITKGWLHLDTMEHNTELNSIRIVDLTTATEIIRW